MIPLSLKLVLEELGVIDDGYLFEILESEKVLTIPKLITFILDTIFCKESNKLLKIKVENILNHLAISKYSSHLMLRLVEYKYIIKSEGKIDESNLEFLNIQLKKLLMNTNGLFEFLKSILEVTTVQRQDSEFAFELAKYICNPNGIYENKLDFYYKISCQVISIIKISGYDEISQAAIKNKFIQSENLRFARNFAVSFLHLYVLINKSWALDWFLKPLFNDFEELTNEDYWINMKQEKLIAFSSDQLLFHLELHLSILNTFKSTSFVVKFIRKFSYIYVNILNLPADENNKYISNARNIMLRLIVLSYEISGLNVVEYIEELTYRTNLNMVALASNLYLRLKLDKEAVEVAICHNQIQLEENPRDSHEHVTTQIDIVTDLIKQLDNENCRNMLCYKLIMSILKDKFSAISNENHASSTINHIIMSSSDHQQDTETLSLYRDFLFCKLIEKIEPESISHFAQELLEFIKKMLEYCQFKMNSFDELNSDKISAIYLDQLSLCLDMVSWVLIYCPQLSQDDRYHLNDVSNIFQQISQSNKDISEEMMNKITNINVIIATRGFINPLTQSRFKVSLIEETTDQTTDEQNQDPIIQAALTDCLDEEPAVIGHGLIVLKNHLQAKLPNNDLPTAQSHKILCVVTQLFYHADPFVYVRSIHVLALLAVLYPDKIIPTIANRVRAGRTTSHLFDDEALCDNIEERDGCNLVSDELESWMNVNEVFMQIIKKLGVLVCRYQSLIVNALLAGLRDTEEIVRAGSISNLAEFCGLMQYGLGNDIYRIVSNICDALTLDDSIQVKIACAIWIRKAILGPEDNQTLVFSARARPEILNIFPADILTQILRTLKRTIESNDHNTLLLDHLSVAYKALDDSVLAFVRPDPQKLAESHRIKILDYID